MRKIFWALIWLSLALYACTPADKPLPPDGGDGPATEDPDVPEGMNLKGRVVDLSGNGMEGVVVSDGRQCVVTEADGTYWMKIDAADVKFIYISTPAGYQPVISGGRPIFYRPLSSQPLKQGVYEIDTFKLTPVDNPGRATVFFTADPQPRAGTAGYDNLGYHSLDCCEDLYQDLQETAAGITGRQVFGVCLGDLVHENMSLYKNYTDGLRRVGYPTYNVIGNHDNNPAANDDDAAAAEYESYFGPRNYSFNVGNIHFVVLDNLMMKDKSGRLTGYDQGLTDKIWEWLQADLSFVPKTMTVATCSHSPMFKTQSGETSARHKDDYANLLKGYAKVFAWAGHTHATHNYVYPKGHKFAGIEVHTLSRCTGELWTNDYMSYGTPRGYTIVEIENGEFASWRFHPVKYQRAKFIGAGTPPPYVFRDWTYDENGVAQMKDGSGVLDESYQMHVYPPVGTYGDSKVYVNVFLWDNLWEKPEFILDGAPPVVMTPVESTSRYDFADTEFKSWYKSHNSTLAGDSSYKASSTSNPNTLFSTPVSATSGSGTVRVTDRFGNVYTETVSW